MCKIGKVGIGDIDNRFCVSFNLEGKQIDIKIKNGEDFFKLADIYKKLLREQNIEYEETSKP